jgi:hypothetical protein
MTKLYTKKILVAPKKMRPSQKTVSFILNYSKALKVIRVNDNAFELIAN